MEVAAVQSLWLLVENALEVPGWQLAGGGASISGLGAGFLGGG